MDLENHSVISTSNSATFYSQVALRFLIGSLYNNFSLLWEPIRSLIESHAHGLSRGLFWPVYSEHLEHLATMNGGYGGQRLVEMGFSLPFIIFTEKSQSVILKEEKYTDSNKSV